MLTHAHILEVCNQLRLEKSVDKVYEHTIIALDGGDTVHRYGEKFEHLNYVRDSSADKLEKGYWLNQISGYKVLTEWSLQGEKRKKWGDAESSFP
jgi:hypothetical protein